MRRVARAVACLVALATPSIIPTTPLHSQTVRVRVVEQESEAAVGGALVALRGIDGKTVGQQLTPPDGGVLLRAPSAGEYRVHVARIAFAPALSEPLTLSAGATAELTMRVASARVSLAGVQISGTRGTCRTNPAQARETAEVWEEIRKALASTELTRTQRLVPIQLRTFERRLTTRLRVEKEEKSEPKAGTDRPFFARPAAELARSGYVVRPDGRPVDLGAPDAGIRDLTFFGPDANVVLAEEFARDHCFRVERGDGQRAGLLGLAFEPAATRSDIVDVQGVLWVDPKAAELRVLEFTYANWNPPVPTPAVGGRVAFERLTSGAWIVKEWAIRMPLFTQEQMPPYRLKLAGYAESGGEAGANLPTVASKVEYGRIEGTLADSLSGAPLSGATVRLTRSPRSVRSDAAGRFVLDSLEAGTDGLIVTHPRLESLGMRLGERIQIAAGETTRLALAVPSYRQFRASCRDTSMAHRGIIVGSIRDAEQSRSLANAAAVFWWVEVDTSGGRPRVGPRELRAITDEAGTFRACGIPTGQMISAQGHAGGFATGIVQMMLDEHAVAGRDFVISLDSTAIATGADDNALPIEPRSTAPTARILGAVFDSTGASFSGAQVRVDGAAAQTVSDENGRFVLEKLPAGTQTLDVRATGFAPVRQVLHLLPTGDNAVSVRLDRVVTLATVEVRGRRAPRAEIRRPIEERAKLLGGFFISPDDLEKRGQAPIYMLFDQIPYLIVMNTPETNDPDRPARQPRINPRPLPRPRDKGSQHEAQTPSSPRETLLSHQPGKEWHDNASSSGLRLFMPGAAGKRCVADVWIDGKLVRSEALFGLTADEIHAIEVYLRVDDVPAKYRRALSTCGAILVWTVDTSG